LKPIKKKFGDALTWSDLIVLAGQAANEAAGMPKTTFCREWLPASGHACFPSAAQATQLSAALRKLSIFPAPRKLSIAARC
jgi:Peroxidase